jgi:hypothetical protein
MASATPLPFEFTENSKAMYDAVLAAPPFFVRWLVRGKVDTAMKARGCGTVTEDIMYEVTREVTPKDNLAAAIEILDTLRTTSTAAR